MERVRSEAIDENRQKLYWRAILLAIGGNILLTLTKGLVAFLSGSSAVFSDAANSMADTMYSILMGIGLFVSQQPADEGHPQGHGQFEPIVSLLIATAMGVAGVTALWQSFQRFMAGAEPIKIAWPTLVLLGAVLVKVIMYILVKNIGQRINSPAIRASARDNLTDVLTSSSALIGVLGSQYLHPVLDPLAGLFVALWIFRSTWEIVHENLGYLTGRGASAELAQQIAETALNVSGVDEVHRVIAEYIGPQLRVDMHINVDGKMTLKKAHDIGDMVIEAVESLPEVDLVFVHIEPVKV